LSFSEPCPLLPVPIPAPFYLFSYTFSLLQLPKSTVAPYLFFKLCRSRDSLAFDFAFSGDSPNLNNTHLSLYLFPNPAALYYMSYLMAAARVSLLQLSSSKISNINQFTLEGPKGLAILGEINPKWISTHAPEEVGAEEKRLKALARQTLLRAKDILSWYIDLTGEQF
jgi:hypothetical protein